MGDRFEDYEYVDSEEENSCLEQFKSLHAPIAIVVGAIPLLFLYVFEDVIYPENVDALRCAGIVILMAIYWMFEVIPLAATALIPRMSFSLFVDIRGARMTH